MVDFLPFRGIRYNSAVTGPVGEQICPPYDVISPAREQDFLARSPHNMVRLELAELDGPAPQGRYTEAADAFSKMLADGALRQDERAAYYILRQRFDVAGQERERVGLFGALRLETLGRGVLPHEDTAAGPKEDRLALMEATQANFSPIMMLYRDSSRAVAQVLTDVMGANEPLTDMEVDGEVLTVWAVNSEAQVSTIKRATGPQPVYIADGHHRYETAVAYRDAIGGAKDAPTAFQLVCLIAFDDPGLLIQPYYRVVHSLDDASLGKLRDLLSTLFRAQVIAVSGASSLDEAVAMAGRGQVALGVVEQGKPPALLTPADGTVPTPDAAASPTQQAAAVEANVLQEMLFRPVMGDSFPDYVAYEHDGAEALAMVERGEGQMAFFIKGVPADAFESVVGAGIRLPRKSTYFHPKLPAGLVINPLY
jgi:uncharacterized protein (DUF1015 family)